MNHSQDTAVSLPALRALAAKVARVHGSHNPRLIELDAAVGNLTDTIDARDDEADEKVRDLLGRVRAAAENFAVPEWACSSYRTLFRELEQLELNLLKA